MATGKHNKFSNQTMAVLVDYLNWNMNMAVIDESGFLKSFDMDLDIDAIIQNNRVVLNTEKVQLNLRRHGFELVQEERMTDVLVIREKNL